MQTKLWNVIADRHYLKKHTQKDVKVGLNNDCRKELLLKLERIKAACLAFQRLKR